MKLERDPEIQSMIDGVMAHYIRRVEELIEQCRKQNPGKKISFTYWFEGDMFHVKVWPEDTLPHE